MGSSPGSDDEAFLRVLDALWDELALEHEARRQLQQAHDDGQPVPDQHGPAVPIIPDEPPTTEDELARLEQATRFWRRPEVKRLLLEQRQREQRALRPGDRVNFRQFLRGGYGRGEYGSSQGIPAVVVRVNTRTVRIRLWSARDGAPVERNVKAEQLTRRSETVSICGEER